MLLSGCERDNEKQSQVNGVNVILVLYKAIEHDAVAKCVSQSQYVPLSVQQLVVIGVLVHATITQTRNTTVLSALRARSDHAFVTASAVRNTTCFNLPFDSRYYYRCLSYGVIVNKDFCTSSYGTELN